MKATMIAARGLLAVAVVFASARAAIGMDIVKDGQAAATIVVEKQPAGGASGVKPGSRGGELGDGDAAKVLADWIEKITDVRLPIADAAPAGKPAICVGAAAVKAGLKLEDIKSPTGEGLRITCDGDRVLLGGQNPTSTVKAACRFLEELGCRYLMDDPLGEVYPRTRTLTVGKLDIAEQPGFAYRHIWGSQWSNRSFWKVWNGAGGTDFNTGHSWGRYVPQRLFDTHPEYFAMRGGSRVKGDWYCTSNGELRKVFAEGVIAAIKAGDRNPSVSPPDGVGYCQCPTCRAQDDPNSLEPSSGQVNVTNRYLDFFDEVGRQVAKAYPDAILSFYCYADYTQAPTVRRKVSPNLCAWIAPIRYSRYHAIVNPNSTTRMQLQETVDGWAKAVDKIGYRTYNFNLAECCVPFSMLSVWKHDIPYLKKTGCIGLNLETLRNWEIYGPHIYLSIRLAYDPAADADAIMDDYFTKFYGPEAGPFMKQYWMSIDKAFADLKCESGSFYALHLVYTPEFLARLEALMDKAAAAAKGDKAYAARLAMTAEGFKNARQYCQVRDTMNKGDPAGAKKLYDELYARNGAELKKGYGNHYTLEYLGRFLGKHVEAGAKAAAAPNKVLTVLPDQWRLEYDKEDAGLQKGYPKSDFDDSKWRTVSTYGNTLNAQGLSDVKTVLWYRTGFDAPQAKGKLTLFFTEIDGVSASVFVNGKEVAALGKEASRKPFEVPLGDAVQPGRNTVAVRVDHSRITELFLGGIIRPVLLIEKGAE